MKPYEIRMKALIGILLFALKVGLAVGVVGTVIMFAKFHMLELSLEVGIAVVILVAPAAAVLKSASEGTLSALNTTLFEGLKSFAVAAVTSACSMNPILLAFALVELFVLMIAGFAILFFMMISFPITAVYTIIMYIVERTGRNIDEDMAASLDKIAPTASAFLTVALVLGAVIIK